MSKDSSKATTDQTTLSDAAFEALAWHLWSEAEVCIPGGCTHDDTGECAAHLADIAVRRVTGVLTGSDDA